jgi:hypothetical protein
MTTKAPQKTRITAAQKAIEAAAKECRKALEYLQESQKIIDARKKEEKTLLANFSPGNSQAVSDLAFARTSQELHQAAIERNLDQDCPEALKAAQEALSEIASALLEAAAKQREDLHERLRKAMNEFGGEQEATRAGGGTIKAGELAASAAAAELPVFTALPSGATWPVQIWNQYPGTFDQAVSILKTTLDSLATMQGMAADWLKNGNFLGNKGENRALAAD